MGSRSRSHARTRRVEFLDSAQFRFWLKAPSPLAPVGTRLEVEDLNFLDKNGRLVMKFEATAIDT